MRKPTGVRFQPMLTALDERAVPDGSPSDPPECNPPVNPSAEITFTMTVGEAISLGQEDDGSTYLTLGSNGAVWLLTDADTNPTFTFLYITTETDAGGNPLVSMSTREQAPPPRRPTPTLPPERLPPLALPRLEDMRPMPPGWTGGVDPNTGVITMTSPDGNRVISIAPDGTWTFETKNPKFKFTIPPTPAPNPNPPR